MISEDIAGQSVTMAQKSLEVAVELAKIAKMIIGLPFKGIGKLIEFSTERKRQAIELVKVLGKDALSGEEISLNGGEVKLTDLKKTGSIAMQTNISAKDIPLITEKAEAYDIPVAFIGKGKEALNVTLAFNAADKAAINQILSEVMNEKLAAKPNDYLTFQMDTLGEAETISAMLKENDIPADITKTVQGKYLCVYEAKNAEALKLIKADFKEAHEKTSKAFDITAAADGKKYTLSDLSAGKTIILGSLPTKEKLMRICREQFGFDNCQAMEAAHKFENTLTGQTLEYFRTDTRQAALLNNFERHIRLSDDNVLVKPYSFTRANFASDNVNRYFVSSGEKAADVFETERMTKIKARIDELKNAEIGSDLRSEIYGNLLSNMRNRGVDFPEYSENNNRIIEREMPKAKQTAGKAFWESQGFKLNEDAKGVEIIAPETDDKGNPVLDENGKQSFSTATVYDISETNAYEKAVADDIARLQSEYAAEKANAFRYFVSSGEKAAALIPDKMSREEMRETVRNKLGISDPETVKALVEKIEKIEVANKIADIKRKAQLSQKSGEIGIERLTNNYAEISKSGITKRYDLRDKAAMLTALKSDFGISQLKAENIFAKAKRQSPLANDLHKLREQSKTKALKTKPVVDKKTSKGARI